MIDKNTPILLIDTSYLIYHRFFALKIWYKKAYPDKTKHINNDIEYDWLNDIIFMEKYDKLFMANILKICKKFKIQTNNIIFALDCPYKTIWRLETNNEYKSTRLESHINNQFNSYKIFSIVKDNYLPKIKEQ